MACCRLQAITCSSVDFSLMGYHGIHPREMSDWMPKVKLHVCRVGKDRVGKDKGIGNFTRVDTTGRSIVDYMVVSPQQWLFGCKCMSGIGPHTTISLFKVQIWKKNILVRRDIRRGNAAQNTCGRTKLCMTFVVYLKTIYLINIASNLWMTLL